MATSMSYKKTARHILELTQEEKIKLFNSFDHIFSDIDGVAFIWSNKFEGLSDGFNALKKAGKSITFITNNSVRPMEKCLQQFKDINLEVTANDIIHPATSIVEYLKSTQFKGLIYVIGTQILKRHLHEAGFEYIDGPNEILEESFSVLARNVFDKHPVRAVIIDVDFNLSSTKLIRAQMYLRHPNCILIGGATDMLLPVDRDINIIGPGPFPKILSEASKKKIISLGKPGRELAKIVERRFPIEHKKRALMIGDMLEQDIGFGSECGFQTMAVLTGGCRREDLFTEENPYYIPDFYADSVDDFVQFIKDMQKSNI